MFLSKTIIKYGSLLTCSWYYIYKYV